MLNVDGYFNSLIELFNKGVEEGFIGDDERQIMVSAETPAELMKKMEVYEMITYPSVWLQFFKNRYDLLELFLKIQKILFYCYLKTIIVI